MAEADGLFATAILLLIDRASGRMMIANAGHPPPLLVSSGHAEFLERPGARSALLGLAVRERGQAETELPAGTTLLLYTDGLVESTRDLDGGMARLESEAAGCGNCSTEELCDHLLAALSPTGRYRDDVTLLAVRRV